MPQLVGPWVRIDFSPMFDPLESSLRVSLQLLESFAIELRTTAHLVLPSSSFLLLRLWVVRCSSVFDKISSNEVSHVKSSQTMKNLFDKPTAVNLLFPVKILTLMTSCAQGLLISSGHSPSSSRRISNSFKKSGNELTKLVI